MWNYKETRDALLLLNRGLLDVVQHMPPPTRIFLMIRQYFGELVEESRFLGKVVLSFSLTI